MKEKMEFKGVLWTRGGVREEHGGALLPQQIQQNRVEKKIAHGTVSVTS